LAELVTFESPDGTTMGAWRSGAGPPLVLVHGTASDHARWNVVLPRLENRFACYALDRRGRGASGDAPVYDVEQEFEDIAALVDAIGGPVDLLGHSFGGLCSMEAALRTHHLRRLILYEPAAFMPGSGVYGQEILERLEWLLAIGDHEGLTVTMLRDVAGVPEKTIDILRRQPYWKARLACAHTVPRELRADEHYTIDPARLSRIDVPTLLLLGGNSPQFYRDATVRLQDIIPKARIHEIPGHEHAAMDTATRQFTDVVLNFLTE
jgi:pimeloyl-ACP methyl ester carboxylesterase